MFDNREEWLSAHLRNKASIVEISAVHIEVQAMTAIVFPEAGNTNAEIPIAKLRKACDVVFKFSKTASAILASASDEIKTSPRLNAFSSLTVVGAKTVIRDCRHQNHVESQGGLQPFLFYRCYFRSGLCEGTAERQSMYRTSVGVET